ncbi:MAG: beta-eliminating lyase-related protein, partial [Cyclobacteriaceae bacterium]
LCKESGLKMHLDGARIFNALVHSGERAHDWGKMLDTISVCLSKGLGCPVGSVLLGDKMTIKRARKIRKALGGGMRQAGILAAAGIYALDHHIGRLVEDHRRAKIIEDLLQKQAWVKEVIPVTTNIIIAKLNENELEKILNKLAAIQVKVVKFGKDQIRLVTHLDFDDNHLEDLEKKIHLLDI